jgi:hypothetical protein
MKPTTPATLSAFIPDLVPLVVAPLPLTQMMSAVHAPPRGDGMPSAFSARAATNPFPPAFPKAKATSVVGGHVESAPSARRASVTCSDVGPIESGGLANGTTTPSPASRLSAMWRRMIRCRCCPVEPSNSTTIPASANEGFRRRNTPASPPAWPANRADGRAHSLTSIVSSSSLQWIRQ